MRYPIIGNVTRDYILSLPNYNSYLYMNFCNQTYSHTFTTLRDSPGTAYQINGIDSFPSSISRTTDKGLLIEEARTNTIEQNFANWVGFAETSLEDVLGPDNYLSATTLNESSLIFDHGIETVVSVVDSESYTLSVFAKADTNQYIQLAFGGPGTVSTDYANFNLAIGESTGSGLLDSSIYNCGNGWYRISATYTANTTGSISAFIYILNTAGGGKGEAYLGTNRQLYIFGPQFELGEFVTSYTTSTRSADDSDINSLTIPNIYTIYSEYELFEETNAIQTLFTIDDGTIYNSIIMYRDVLNAIRLVVTKNGTTVFTKKFSNKGGDNRILRVAISYDETDWIVSCDGFNSTKVGNADLTLHNVSIGSNYESTALVNSFVRKFIIYNVAYDSDSLAILTSSDAEDSDPVLFYLLQENGDDLLKEDSSRFIIE